MDRTSFPQQPTITIAVARSCTPTPIRMAPEEEPSLPSSPALLAHPHPHPHPIPLLASMGGLTTHIMDDASPPTPSNLPEFTDEKVLLLAVEYPSDLRDGLLEIMRHCPYQNFALDEAMRDADSEIKWNIRFNFDTDCPAGHLSVSSSHPNYKQVPYGEQLELSVRYNRRIEAFRALGRILGAISGIDSDGDIQDLMNFKEATMFERLGLMIDCSRGGVVKLDKVFYILRCCSLMGLNSIQLYTEDTYEIRGEPFFGYLRGRFTLDELSRIDQYAHDLNIEVIPCIQTLGHLGQILQWPRFYNVRGSHEVLSVNTEDTYMFIERMIKDVTGALRSKKIHLGMDEAYELTKQTFGNKDGTTVFLEHLNKVVSICRKLNLEPLIWSDMLFCLAAKNNSLQGYYDPQSAHVATEKYSHSLPEDLELVYWDYYHTHEDVYENKIQSHKDLGCVNPWVFGGVWTWNRLWTALGFTFECTRSCLRACKKKAANSENGEGVRNVFVTIWGDDGNECDMYSALPGLLYFAEQGYTDQDEIDVRRLKQSFRGICGGDFDDFVLASKIDDLTNLPTPNDYKTHFPPNPGKWLLWEDPISAHLSPQYTSSLNDMFSCSVDLESHYSALFDMLSNATSPSKIKHYPLNKRLKIPQQIAMVLSLKCHLRERLVSGYKSAKTGDKSELESLILDGGRLPKLREEVDRLWKLHRSTWLSTFKPQGLEIIELRYGGLRTRLQTLHERLLSFLKTVSSPASTENRESFSSSLSKKPLTQSEDVVEGDFELEPQDVIPELEEELQVIWEGIGTNLVLDYSRAATVMRGLGTG
ncbi:glycoside hydrolase superfamily [Paraphysoderma sedebokerense]|nr:glycoside hydrolase superfamily [Paraphysoderma sedebokerense]